MEQSPSWEANRSSDGQEIFPTLRNLQFHRRFHNSPPLLPILSQMNPAHAIQLYLKSFSILSSHILLLLLLFIMRSSDPHKATSPLDIELVMFMFMLMLCYVYAYVSKQPLFFMFPYQKRVCISFLPLPDTRSVRLNPM